MKQYKKIHICAKEPPEDVDWNHNDWFYSLHPNHPGRKAIGKLHKRRCHATREANKLADEVVQWYPI